MGERRNGDPTRLSEVCRALAALSDRNRYRIVELLSANGSELSSGAIGLELGLSPSLISHHLSTLEATGLIARRKDGLWTFNRLRRDEIARHLSTLQSLVAANGGD